MTDTATTAARVEPIVLPFEPFYSDERCTIYNADCRQVLPFLEPFSLLLTDPPYGLGMDRAMMKENGKQTGKAKAQRRHYAASGWDDSPPPRWFLDSAQAAAAAAILWGGNYYGLPAASCWLVWDKETNGHFADCELAWTNLPGAVRKFKWRWNGMLQEHSGDKKEQRVHPTQKPLALMRWCLGLVPDAQTVLDPFMGSGTTLAAAKIEGRHAVGIEINERYCELAADRLRQGVLF
jgi:DNA modification methylase